MGLDYQATLESFFVRSKSHSLFCDILGGVKFQEYFDEGKARLYEDFLVSKTDKIRWNIDRSAEAHGLSRLKYLENQLSDLVKRVFPIYLVCPENLKLLTEEVHKLLFNTISIEASVSALNSRDWFMLSSGC